MNLSPEDEIRKKKQNSIIEEISILIRLMSAMFYIYLSVVVGCYIVKLIFPGNN